MSIVSLLPSTTQIAFALGLGDEVVAVTHKCNSPPAARLHPVIIASALDHTEAVSVELRPDHFAGWGLADGARSVSLS